MMTRKDIEAYYNWTARKCLESESPYAYISGVFVNRFSTIEITSSMGNLLSQEKTENSGNDRHNYLYKLNQQRNAGKDSNDLERDGKHRREPADRPVEDIKHRQSPHKMKLRITENVMAAPKNRANTQRKASGKADQRDCIKSKKVTSNISKTNTGQKSKAQNRQQ